MHSAEQRPVDTSASHHDARQRLLCGLPVTPRRMQFGGVPAAIVEGGSGPRVVLLHGPAANAMRRLQELRGAIAEAVR